MRIWVALLIFAAGLAAAGTAHATAAGQQAIKNFAVMDKCNRDAQAAFPDYSSQAYAAREARLKSCLEGANLPPRAPLEPKN